MSEELNERPSVFLSIRWIWDAFFVLSAVRTNSGIGPNPIQMSEIFVYCQINDIVGTDVSYLSRAIMQMDLIFIAWINKRSKSDGD